MPTLDPTASHHPTARGARKFTSRLYEKETPQTVRWEYRVLAIDPRESALPDAEQLNALGKEGWILVEILDERAT